MITMGKFIDAWVSLDFHIWDAYGALSGRRSSAITVFELVSQAIMLLYHLTCRVHTTPEEFKSGAVYFPG